MAGHVAGHQLQKPRPCDDAHTSRWSRRGDCQYLFFVTTAVIGRVSDAELACCARAFDETAPALVAPGQFGGCPGPRIRHQRNRPRRPGHRPLAFRRTARRAHPATPAIPAVSRAEEGIITGRDRHGVPRRRARDTVRLAGFAVRWRMRVLPGPGHTGSVNNQIATLTFDVDIAAGMPVLAGRRGQP